MNFIKYKNSVFHGDAETYGTNGLLMGGTTEQMLSLAGDELPADSLEFTVNCDALIGGLALLMDEDKRPLQDEDGNWLLVDLPNWLDFRSGDPLDLYTDPNGNVIGRFYVTDVKQKSKRTIQFTCTDAVGIISRMPYHGGGLYDGEPAANVINDIMAGTGITYSIGAEIEAIEVYGHLRYANRRDNLLDLLMAYGISLYEVDGETVFSVLSDTQAQTQQNNVIYLDSGEIAYRTPATEIRVTEHGYMQTADGEQTTLFDNTDTLVVADHMLVVFDEPCHDVTATGTLTIEESNVNYAIVSGIGTLTGLKYQHTTNVIVKMTGAEAETNIKTFDSNELITAFNSANVATRLADYYALTMGVNYEFYDATGMIAPGTKLDFVDPFGTERTGWVERRTFELGNKMRSQITVAVDWSPGPSGGNYEHVEVFTEDGTWTPPSGTERIRIVAIGGGQAGQTGFDGAKAASDGTMGKGGDRGRGGAGGKVYMIDLDDPQGTFSIHVGSAGTPSSSAGAPGGYGGETTVTNGGTVYTSADGVSSPSGYRDFLSGTIYGKKGVNGIAGADGGSSFERYGTDGDPLSYEGQTWSGGLGRESQTNRWGYYGGGAGGGAAYGKNGNSGSAGTPGRDVPGLPVHERNRGGAGGTGGAAEQLPVDAGPGDGGVGGCGGGGGGGGGYWSDDSDLLQRHSGYESGANGGSPSQGRPGGPGLALIYY